MPFVCCRCPLFNDLQATRVIISMLPNSDRASLALTCSLARTTVHSESTKLNFSRGNNSGSSSSIDSAVSLDSISRGTQLLQRCLKDPRWARLEALQLPASFHNGLCSAAGQVAQRWPHLRSLTLVGNDQPGHEPLPTASRGLQAAWWAQLVSLMIKGIYIDVGAAQRLAQARLDNLQELCLDNNELHDTGLAQVLTAPWPNLSSLTISANGLSSTGMQHLAAVTHLTALSVLGLQNNLLDMQAMQALAACSHLRLAGLDLSGNEHMHYSGLVQLLAGTHLVSGLRSLGINQVALTNLAPLAAATHLSSLTSLEFCDNYFAATLAIPFGTATHLSTLRHLTLGFSSPSSVHTWYHTGFMSLLKQLPLPHLTSLVVKHVRLNHVSDEAGLDQAKLPALQTLLIAGLKSKGGIIALSKAQWPQLQELDLAGNDSLTASALGELWRMRRGCPALRRLVVPHGVNAESVRARLARGDWVDLAVAEHLPV